MPTRIYVIERYLDLIDDEGLAALAHASSSAANETGAAYLGSVAVPDDDTCFCLFRASSDDEIRMLLARIGVPHERVVEAIAVTPQPHAPNPKGTHT